MLDADAIADVEGDADLLLRLARIDDEDVVDVLALARHRTMTGRGIFRSRTGPESYLSGWGDDTQVCIRAGLLPERARWLVGHELAELHYRRIGYVGEDREARCDALGAALVAPRRAMRRAIREHAHRVHSLARELQVTQSLALLRLGEVDQRPVLLDRPGGVIVRGRDFVWPSGPGLARAILRGGDGCHPCPIRDEEGRRGLMAA